MLTALIQALGLDITFFVEFLIWLALYPIILKGLITPYMILHNQKESSIGGRNKRSEILQEQITHLKLKYETIAQQLQSTFRMKYQKQSQPIKEQILREGIQKKQLLKKEANMQLKNLDREVHQTEQALSSEITHLTSEVLLCLTQKKIS